MAGAKGKKPRNGGQTFLVSEFSPRIDGGEVEFLCGELERLASQLRSQMSNVGIPAAQAGAEGGTLPPKPVPALPSTRALQRLIRNRRKRNDYLPKDLFSDPGWDMLLELILADGEGRQVSIKSLCLSSGVPATTALRWIGVLESHDLIVRHHDQTDRRRVLVNLTPFARRALARLFADLDAADLRLI